MLNILSSKLKKCNLCPAMVASRFEVMGQDHAPCSFVGNNNAKYMFVGIAPGRLKTKSNKNPQAFKHGSGRILRKIIEDFSIGINDVFITNILKCNTPKNNKFQDNDIKNCTTNFLLKEINYINPEKIIVLGKDAENKFKKYVTSSQKFSNIHYVWHPASVLYGKKYSDYKKQFEVIFNKGKHE